MNPSISTSEILLPSKAAPIGGWALIGLGSAVLIAGGLMGLFGEERIADGLSLIVLAALFGGGFLRAGALLVVPKGGLKLLPQGARGEGPTLLFGGVGSADGLSLPVSSVVGLRLVPRDEEWDRHVVRTWSCEVVCRSGLVVLVAESPHYDAVWTFARRLDSVLAEARRHSETLALEELEAWAAPAGDRESGAPLRGAGPWRCRVGVRGRFNETLLGFGAVAMAVGGFLFARVTDAPVVGFLFGPTLFFMGLAVLLVALAGRFATAIVTWDEEGIRRETRWGRLTWGRKLLPHDPAPYVRLRHRGLLGASLELVGPTHIAVLVTGVTARSALGYEGLLAHAQRLVS